MRLNSDAQESDSASILSGKQENGRVEGPGPQHKAREVLLSPLVIPEELTPQHPHPTRPYSRPITPIDENSVSNPDRTSPPKQDGIGEKCTSKYNHYDAYFNTTPPSSAKKPERRRSSASSSLSIDSPKNGARGGGIKVGSAQPAGGVVTTSSNDEGKGIWEE